MRGTTLKETVDGVAVTLTRIVKAVDEIQKTKDTQSHTKRRPVGKDGTASTTTPVVERQKNGKSDRNDDNDSQSLRFSSANSSLSTVSTRHLASLGAWMRPQGFGQNVTFNHPASNLVGVVVSPRLITSIANDYFRRDYSTRAFLTTSISQTRGLGSTAASANNDTDGDSRSGKSPLGSRPVKAPPTAADIKRKLKAKPKLPPSAKENRVPTV